MFESFDEKNGGFGPVQVAIVNHAYGPPAFVPISQLSLERWNLTLNANLTSSFLVLRQYMRGLEGAAERLKDKAAVVLIGSTAGKFGEAGHLDYAVTKSGVFLHAHAKILVYYLHSHDVRNDLDLEERDCQDRTQS